jgi:voltage-dependent potassium channel beta subunit
MAATPHNNMKYRFLGDTGLLVSVFGFGCFMQSDADVDGAYDLMVRGFQQGVNFFDTAETYGAGASERGVGQVIKRGIANGVWSREDLVISTKICLGVKAVLDLTEGNVVITPNSLGLGRKHLIEGIKASLGRLQLDYVDVIFCHRPEKFTPIEEVVRSMNFIINQGWAFYWGTSEWQEEDILEACEIADRLGLIRPVVEQPEYSLFNRSKVEVDFQSLYKKYKLGLTTWSPLAYGVLTGKYANGIPEGSRLAVDFFRAALNKVGDINAVVATVEKLRPIAEELECSLAQLAVAWCASNPNVSSVLLGAKSAEQLDETLKGLVVIPKITPEIKEKMEAIIPFAYKPATRDFHYSIRERYL